jgi:hypothetical protein
MAHTGSVSAEQLDGSGTDTSPRDTSVTQRPIFVVGFPRSGTTLIHSLIGAHPRIAAPPEMHYFVRIVRHWRYWGDLSDDANLRRVIDAAVNTPKFVNCGFDADRIFARAKPTPRSYGDIFDAIMHDFATNEGKQRWCEKTPLQSARFIWQELPEAQVVHVVRDPRESLASGLELTGGHDPSGNARLWRNFTTGNIRGGAERGSRYYLRIRYEDLARDPQAVMGVVFAFLGEEFDGTAVTDIDRRRAALPPVVVPWQAKILEPIKAPEEGAYRSRMNWHQRARIAAIVGDMLPSLGYLPPQLSTVALGRALNIATKPRDYLRRRRVRSAAEKLRTPEQRYTTAVRNWRTIHENATVEGVQAGRRRVDPVDTIGVFLG